MGINDSLVEAGSNASEENSVEMNTSCICYTVHVGLIAGLGLIRASE